MKSSSFVSTVLTISLAIALSCYLANTARADVTLTGFSASGPGGTATEFTTSGFTAWVTENFTTNSYIDLTFTFQGSGLGDIEFVSNSGVVVNNSGVTWNGYTLEMLSEPPGTQFTYGVTYYTSILDIPTVTDTRVDFSGGLPLNNGGAFCPDVYFNATGPGALEIRTGNSALPEFTATPEPSALLIGGIGTLILLGYSARKRSRKASFS
jgi:hypothetical protein